MSERELPIIAVYRDRVIELNAESSEELDEYFALLAAGFARLSSQKHCIKST